MNDFAELLKRVVDRSPFDGSIRALARKIRVNHSHLSRTLTGDRSLSPNVVGRVARLLPETEAEDLIKAYLRQIAAEIAQAHRHKPVTID